MKRNPSLILSWYFQIMDSVMALFRVDFTGRGELADRQQKLGQMLSRLQKISEGYKFIWAKCNSLMFTNMYTYIQK